MKGQITLELSTESLARVCARRPWRVVAVWAVVLVAALLMITTLLEGALTTEFGFSNEPDSDRADRLLAERLRGPEKLSEIVIVQAVDKGELTVDDAAFQERVESLYAAILALGKDRIEGGVNYYQFRDESLVSADRSTTIMPFAMTGKLDDITKKDASGRSLIERLLGIGGTSNIQRMLNVIEAADGSDGFRVLTVGEPSISFDSNELSVKDIEKGEHLLVLFGALLAALLPVLLAIIAIVVALGATALVGQAFQLSFFVTLMISMIGLAVGIDYSLIVLSRYREELRRGLSKAEAIAKTGATANRTVFFSGVTVVLALAGMLIIPSTIFQSLGAGAILVVVSAVLAALTLLPAVLSLMGGAVNRLRIPLLGRRVQQSPQSAGGFWDWATRTVMGNPVLGLVIAAGVMIAAASSYLDINTGFNGVDSFPDGVQTKEAFLVLEEEFSFGVVSPTEIVVDGDAGSAKVQEAIVRLQARLDSDAAFVGQSTVRVNDAGDLTLVSVPVAGGSSSDVAVSAVSRLRDEYIPQEFGDVDAEVLVTGFTAFNMDFFDLVDTFTPIVIGVVLALSFLLLMVVFRSIVVPAKAIVMNLLSVGAAYGLMVLVFQKGVGADLLGFQQSDMIDAWIPLFLFSVLFGLSMDYHVFLLSRIRERFDQTRDNTDAVAYGLRATAGLITGAALIMVAVFSGFAMGDMVSNQQVGFGLAVAVFLDATVVRSILVPASMKLLGDFNWYFPAFLRWLPDVRVEAEEPAPVPAAGD